MLLGRLRIRGRLALLILVPLIATLVQTVAAAVEIGQQAARAAQTANQVRSAGQVAVLVRSLQQERLASVGLLLGQVGHTDLLLAQAASRDAAEAVAPLGLRTVDGRVLDLSPLDQLRAGIMAGAVRPVDVVTGYSQVVTALLDGVRLLDVVDGHTQQGREAIAVDAVLRANEGFAAVLASMIAGRTPNIVTSYIAGLSLLQQGAYRFVAYATPAQTAMYGIAQEAVNGRLGKDFNNAMVVAPGTTVGILDTPPSYPDVVALSGIGQYVESKVINDAIASANDAAIHGTTRVVEFVGLSVVLILVAIALGIGVARSVANPLRRLTRSAENVARLAESELVRVADDDSGDAEQVRLPPIEVSGRDELADFARAFGRVQETAARLVQRQAASRRNVAIMFGHVGRRTQNLVGRQISLIDRLESRETEPDRLSDLYRLDHISSRLRRNASSLVVLSGSGQADEHVAPVALDEVVRLGLAEIEGYTRVDVRLPGSIHVAPALINDLALILAELMENATGFSPPGTRVLVTCTHTRDGLRVSVIDHGLGMTAERLAQENTRLTRRERLDLAPTEVLGLFVVGRLARRHSLAVTLAATPGGGVTAEVDLPGQFLSDTQAVTAIPLPATGLSRVDRPVIASSPAGPRLDLLGRASITVREVQPWDAFAAGSQRAQQPALLPMHPPALPPMHPPVQWPMPVAARESPPVATPRPMYPPPLERPRPAAPPAPRPRATPPAPYPSAFPSAPPAPRPSAPPAPRSSTFPAAPPAPRSSTLNRRVPGATLDALPGNASPRTVPLAPPSSPAEVRDSLAQFESGIARAMREVQQGDQG